MQTNFTCLKSYLLSLLFSFSCCHLSAQLANGGLHANFGVDADTRADYVKYGPLVGSVRSEDWFSHSGVSKGVIDTSNAAYFKSRLVNNENICFVKKMSAPLYTKWNNALWIDAVYCRDYIKLDSAHVDTTSFSNGCKNAGDPTTWVGGPGGVSNKNDLLDVYTHMRRNGTNITDSLWLFTAASTTGTTGSRYYDIELFKNNFSFDATTGKFTSPGPDGGHTQWLFDAAGNVTQTGDLIIAITYNPGTAPIIEVRIWVARNAYNTVNPTFFKFNGLFDANTNNSPYGYASIVSKTGNTAFGSGAGNYTATATDSTYSTPWGTTTSTWNANYEPLQVVEVGLNLTRIGLDPSLYSALGNQACGSFFKSIFYKSRSSASFSSSLNDFVGPLDFMRIPVLDHSIKTDTLSCRKTVGTLRVTSNTTAALYQWRTPTGTNVSASSLAVNKPGVYILSSTIATGCATGRVDTVRVLSDSLKPVATANMGADILGQMQLFGGDPVASNYPTAFGGSKGLSYSWSGPSGFTSLLQNPLAGVSGQYTNTVTELRNGCTSTASVYASLAVLSEHNLNLKGDRCTKSVKLTWNNPMHKNAVAFEVERSLPGKPFAKIATLRADALLTASSFSYIDNEAGTARNIYRIREVNQASAYSYSNIVTVQAGLLTKDRIQVLQNQDRSTLYVNVDTETSAEGSVAVYSVSGELLYVQKFRLWKGSNSIEVNSSRLIVNQLKIATVYIGNELKYTAKIN